MKKIFDRIKILLKIIDEDNISEFAAEISFFTILSLVPFIIFFFSIFKYTNLDNEFIFFIINEFIPNGTEEFFYNLINENYSKYVNLISISGIIALWSAAKGVYSLVKGIRNVYKENSNTSIIIMKIEACLYTIILIFSILLIVFIIAFLKKIEIENSSIILFCIFEIFSKFKGILILCLSFCVLLSTYIIIPKKYKSISKQIPGAIFSSIAWYGITLFFSRYINIFEKFSNNYGSLASIILVMIWLYVCVYIILIGAEINITYEKRIRDNIS